jgi:hypothetical protein
MITEKMQFNEAKAEFLRYQYRKQLCAAGLTYVRETDLSSGVENVVCLGDLVQVKRGYLSENSPAGRRYVLR